MLPLLTTLRKGSPDRVKRCKKFKPRGILEDSKPECNEQDGHRGSRPTDPSRIIGAPDRDPKGIQQEPSPPQIMIVEALALSGPDGPAPGAGRHLESTKGKPDPVSLETVTLTPSTRALPGDVVSFLEAADERIESFLRHRRDNPIHSYVSSDFPLAYSGLRALVESPVLTGDRFCEWGSGFGVVTGLAALLDFEAFGIEIESDLVGEAEELAASFEIPATFSCGNFIPGGDDNYRENLGPSPYLEIDADAAYDDLGLELEEFDIIYAYPWPGEEQTLSDIFEHYAAPGAVLVLHHGLDGLIVRRKPRPARSL